MPWREEERCKRSPFYVIPEADPFVGLPNPAGVLYTILLYIPA